MNCRRGARPVLDSRTNDLGEASEKTSARHWALITTNESTVIAKTFLELIAIVVEDLSAIDVFPIPPGPMRAMGSNFLASPMTFSTDPSRPEQAPGAGGGDSPRKLL